VAGLEICVVLLAWFLGNFRGCRPRKFREDWVADSACLAAGFALGMRKVSVGRLVG
jgi:hypothetical protein